MPSLFSRLTAEWRRLRSERRGNVLMIFGFALVPMTFATGMTIDYARAARTQTRLNAVTDAAALAGVTPQMLSKTRWESILAIYQNFYAQAGVAQCGGSANRVIFATGCSYSGSDNAATGKYTFTDGTLSVVVTDVNTVGLSRTVQLTYAAKSGNIFGNVLSMASIPIGGTTTTNAKVAPDIDFYVLLDTSGSMAFPSTSAGIALLKSKANNCAFACHATNGSQTARDANGKINDYYGVALSYNIPLRVDDAKKAVSSMMTLATSTSANNNATYRAALYSFAAGDARAQNSFKNLKTITGNLASIGTAAQGASTSLYEREGCPTKDYCNDDRDTATSDAFTRINTAMPNPGNGTKVALDKPQEILFIVTDGMRDENRPGNRPEVTVDSALCTAVKARGIRIAILYTEFLLEAVNNDSWSVDPNQGNIVNRLPLIEPALTDCASPGLMYKVTTDDDISAALNKLFLASVTNAHITN